MVRMHVFRLLAAIWALSAFVDRVVAVEIADLIPLIPDCALPCVLSGLTAAAIADPELTCKNVSLQASLSACVQGKCNYSQQVQLSKVNNKLCENVPIDNSRIWLQGNVMFIFFPIALLAVVIRIYSRCKVSRRLGLDDWLILLSGVVLVVVFVLNVMSVFSYGFGRHYWNIDPTKVVILLKTFWVSEILYLLNVTLVKASYLTFYLRIFPARWFKIADLTILVLVIANGIGAIASVIAQCQPINAIWNPSLMPAKCINVNVLAYAQGAIAVAFDITILILPIPELVKLNMNFWKKMQLLFMFSLGGVACITSIVRLQYLVHFATSTDSTWDNALATVWSVIEIHIAVICACLPAARQLISFWFPSMFNSTASSKYEQSSKRTPKSSAIRMQTLDDTIISPTKKPSTDSSNQRFLTRITNAEGTILTKVWADQREAETNNGAHEQIYGTTSRDYSTSESSMYVLEGPRKSDEEMMVRSEAREIKAVHEESLPRNKGNHVYIEMCTTQTTSTPNPTMKPLPQLPRDNGLK